MSARRLSRLAILATALTALFPGVARAWTFDPPVGDLPIWQFEEQRLSDRMMLKVNVAGGNLLLRSQDVSIAGTGLPLELTRTYNNLDHSFDGDFGHGQMASMGRKTDLACSADGQTVTFKGPTGEYAKFTKNAGGGYNSPTGYRATLTKNADSTEPGRV